MDLGELVQQYDGFYAPRFVVTVDTRSFSESSGLISDLSIDATLDGTRDRVADFSRTVTIAVYPVIGRSSATVPKSSFQFRS